jgi:glutamate racemase
VSHRPIGIFDSGIGGLTVFREISKILPHEDLIYLGDTARVPYGTKSAATVTRYAIQNLKFLLQENIKLAVVACNTASAFALDELRGQFSIPLLGVIEPGVSGALRAVSKRPTKNICVIGTEGTIASEAYARKLREREPAANVSGVPCPLFVPLVEEGWWDHRITEQVARIYLKDALARGLDSLILGCTHYPLLKQTLRQIVGPETVLVDSAEETAREAAALLDSHDLKRGANDRPLRNFFVTDSPERFRKLGRMILAQELTNVHHVEI